MRHALENIGRSKKLVSLFTALALSIEKSGLLTVVVKCPIKRPFQMIFHETQVMLTKTRAGRVCRIGRGKINVVIVGRVICEMMIGFTFQSDRFDCVRF